MNQPTHKLVADPLLPAEMLLNLYSPNAGPIDQDDDWRRAKIYLRALFQRHGPFQIEITRKGIWVPSSHV